MPNALTRRLLEYTLLTEDDLGELALLNSQPTHTIPAKSDLVRQGDTPRSVFLILDGWGCHYRALPDGRRQIVDFAIPGDLCDLNVFILDAMDHSVGALTTLKVAEIGRETFRKLVTHFPNITTALWWQELVSKSISREWILNVGQRRARERIAHLFCEMFMRLESIGLTDRGSCEFPPTQNDIADATGLTPVHVNRTIKELRDIGLISLEDRRLTILDMVALQRVGSFSPAYLHHRRNAHHENSTRAAPESFRPGSSDAAIAI